MRARTIAVVAWLALAACSRGDPPTPPGSPSVALPVFPPSAAASSVAPPPASTADAPSASAAPSPSAASPDPSLLPQTHDRPEASGPAFEARVAALWDAIVADDPPRAMPFFFPLGAYKQVKDVGDPASDWSHRLVAAFARDIHGLHARLGDAAGRAQLVGLDVPDDHARARWVEPGEEYNKIGYFRVFGSRLRYTIDGAPHAAEVKSLISWRGAWYVVHLSAIK